MFPLLLANSLQFAITKVRRVRNLGPVQPINKSDIFALFANFVISLLTLNLMIQ